MHISPSGSRREMYRWGSANWWRLKPRNDGLEKQVTILNVWRWGKSLTFNYTPLSFLCPSRRHSESSLQFPSSAHAKNRRIPASIGLTGNSGARRDGVVTSHWNFGLRAVPPTATHTLAHLSRSCPSSIIGSCPIFFPQFAGSCFIPNKTHWSI